MFSDRNNIIQQDACLWRFSLLFHFKNYYYHCSSHNYVINCKIYRLEHFFSDQLLMAIFLLHRFIIYLNANEIKEFVLTLS